MMREVGFEGHYTNHSLRVSLASRLFDAEVDKQLIMSRTGHLSTDSVRAYKRASTKLKRLTSDVLNNVKRNTTTEQEVDIKEKPEIEHGSPELPQRKRPCKENMVSSFHITGGSNITINIHS